MARNPVPSNKSPGASEEAYIPQDWMHGILLEVIQAQNMVFDDTFHDIKGAPPDPHPADKPLARPSRAVSKRAMQASPPARRREPGEGVE